MEPRISLITLGVADIARARAFYEALGWTASSASTPEVVFFHGSGPVLALWARAALAEDAEVEDRPSGFSGVALAYNARSEAEVDEVFAQAVKLGAQAVKIPRKTFWGGYAGYFADPDWHLWEIAFNPSFALDEEGHLTLPP
jgi:catechol 2,3-dioxygenase-like lactoylglutathione lyase family enzyme